MIDNRTAKELAAKLHSANGRVVSAGLTSPENTEDRKLFLSDASALIKEVIESLLDQPGQTDSYGNPTER